MTDNENPLHFVTPFTEDGPLYPPGAIPKRTDLTGEGKAQGQDLVLMGIISNFRNEPVHGVLVEIWQADSNGYYDHPRARGKDALDDYWKISLDDLDPNFRYFGAVETDSNGIYWFRTIIPRWYHVFGTDRGAAHILVKLRSMDNGVLTTELYFPGKEDKSHQKHDKVFGTRRQQSDLLVKLLSSEKERLSGVPLVEGARYCRKDMSFL